MFTLVLPENAIISTPDIPKVETTTKTVESNETLKETPSEDSTRKENNKRPCMIKNQPLTIKIVYLFICASNFIKYIIFSIS